MAYLFPAWGWAVVAVVVVFNVIVIARCVMRRDWQDVFQASLQFLSLTLLAASDALGPARAFLLVAGFLTSMCWAVPAARGRKSLFDRRPAA